MAKVVKLLAVVLMLAGFICAMMDSEDMSMFYRTKAISIILLASGTLSAVIAQGIENIKERNRGKIGGKETKL